MGLAYGMNALLRIERPDDDAQVEKARNERDSERERGAQVGRMAQKLISHADCLFE